jgi:hypothetical protein
MKSDTPALNLSPDLSLPADVAKQVIAVFGVRDAGKTNTGGVIAEETYRAGGQVIVLDPLDVWWGIRASADGTGAGLPFLVFGGAHGDLPLLIESATAIADFLVESRHSAVLSLSHLLVEEQRQFVALFLARLYHRKSDPAYQYLTLLVCDEMALLAPQQAETDAKESSAALRRVTQLGRTKGFGVVIISQRSADVDKRIVSQATVLIVHQTTLARDRKRIEEWMDAHTDHDDKRAFLNSLKNLEVGWAWVWIPGKLDVFQKVQIRLRDTFNSSATPEFGEARLQPRTLADVNLDEVRSFFETMQPTAPADAPIDAPPNTSPVRVVERVVTVEKSVLDDLTRGWLERKLNATQEALDAVKVQLQALVEVTEKMRGGATASTARRAVAQAHFQSGPPTPEELEGEYIERLAPAPPSASSGSPSDVPLDDYALGLLKVVVQSYPARLTLAQLAVLAKRSTKSSAFRERMRVLKQRGLLAEAGPLLESTEAGFSLMGTVPARAVTPEVVIEAWRDALPDGPRRMFDVLLKAYQEDEGRFVAWEELARAIGNSPNSSATRGFLTTLRQNGLAQVRAEPHGVRLNPAPLFPAKDGGSRE